MFLLQFEAVRLLLRGLGLGLMAALLALMLSGAGALAPLERGASGALFRLRGPRAPQSRIVLLVIDQETVARAGRSALPRRFYAQTLQRLRAEGARVIAFNFVFGTRSEHPDQDALLAREFAARPDSVKGFIFDAPGATNDQATLRKLPAFSIPNRGAGARTALSLAAPPSALVAPQSGLGHLNLRPESGGEVRSIPHLIRFEGKLYPSLALAMALKARGQNPADCFASPGQIEAPSLVTMAGGFDALAVPSDENGETLINWLGGEGTFERLSMARLLDGLVPRGALRGATVLIGGSFSGSYAPLATPFSDPQLNTLSALDLQANACDDILSNRVLRPLPTAYQILVLAVCSLGAGALLARRDALGALGWMVLGSLALWSVGVLLLFANFLLPLATPQIALVLTGAACLGVRQWREAGELRSLHEVFDVHVGAEVLRVIKGNKTKLDGELRHVAILFCDIRGFSTLAEELRDEPEHLLRLLNDHFEPIVHSLKEHGAYVDNYVGDLVMAVFGAPLAEQSGDRNTRQATLAALDVLRVVERRNHQRESLGEPRIEIGVGVHCGLAVVGALGTSRKAHYTAIGDTVNIASRVERETRVFGTGLLVTEEVVRACRDHPDTDGLKWQFIAETPVKGRVSSVKLFSPLRPD